jgi:beta-carotene 3-hydroxylase
MKSFLITLISFLGMEAVTWLTHRFVMHGFLWRLHEDHHNKRTDSFLEKNDSFFVIFSIPSICLFAAGTYLPDMGYMFFMGLGISIYGFAYFMIHEIFIHQRFKIFTRTDSVYFRAIRKAHKMHHKHLGKDDGECFGMLLVPFKYFIEAAKQNR